MQGTLSAGRRSYDTLYQEMLSCGFRAMPKPPGPPPRPPSPPSPPPPPSPASRTWRSGAGSRLTPVIGSEFYERQPDMKAHVKLIGSVPREEAEFSKALQVPAELADTHVSLHANLPYRDFFHAIYSSWALLPRLGSKLYLRSKITSTLLSSLSTHVPLVVNEEFLAAYTMLNASTVIRMQPNETVCALYNRIAAMPPPEYGALRRNLRALAEELNTRVLDYIVGQLERTA
ncbi:hypothetical protein HYH03_018756 [Edaphochlamys debaryana]|uniref:Uncharacterized protein n=1 Tax=Edaphochlamys debaryana TaxID=47281 RepID=A0A835XL94_9CHLO|nr:hypothetical protein HYH03_018756 [Edaphochlamys debaryana]|eukprot:KAG2482314.1 hypothetical protein HYH03_018756 [Edaphochlamys debaryana]